MILKKPKNFLSTFFIIFLVTLAANAAVIYVWDFFAGRPNTFDLGTGIVISAAVALVIAFANPDKKCK